MVKDVKTRNIVNDAIIKDLSDSIHNLTNGIVTITVQNSKILRIEVTNEDRIHEKCYDEVWTIEDGGGI